MAFNRKVSLVVGEFLQEGSTGTGLEISDLDIEFTIDRSITVSENQATFIIYNASEKTRTEILKEGNNIIFKAGYEDEEFGIIFIGCIDNAFSTYNGADWVTEITAYSARSAKSPVKRTTLALSYAPGTTLGKILKDVGTGLDLVVIGSENAQFEQINGFVFVGRPGEFFRKMNGLLLLHDVGLFVDNAEIVIYKLDGSSSFSAVRLELGSGLLSAVDITEGALSQSKKNTNKKGAKKRLISFKSLLDPNIRPNGLLDIAGNSVVGVFLVEKVVFQGDNYGGSFVCEGVATA